MGYTGTKEELHFMDDKYIVGEKPNGELFYRKKWIGVYDGATYWDKIELSDLPKYVLNDLDDNVLNKISKQLI